MSEVHDQAIHLLAQPQAGTFLTPEAREMVLRALEEVADEDEIERLRVAVEQARDTFTDLVICLNVLRHPIAAEACQIAARAMQDALRNSPAAPKEDVKVPSATPLPTEPAGDVSFACEPCREGRCNECVIDGPDFNCRHPGCTRIAVQRVAPILPVGEPLFPVAATKRNTPDLCVIDGCTEKGASRNQWCCGGHAAKLNLTERRAALDAWKKARMNGAAPALAGGTP